MHVLHATSTKKKASVAQWFSVEHLPWLELAQSIPTQAYPQCASSFSSSSVLINFLCAALFSVASLRQEHTASTSSACEARLERMRSMSLLTEQPENASAGKPPKFRMSDRATSSL